MPGTVSFPTSTAVAKKDWSGDFPCCKNKLRDTASEEGQTPMIISVSVFRHKPDVLYFLSILIHRALLFHTSSTQAPCPIFGRGCKVCKLIFSMFFTFLPFISMFLLFSCPISNTKQYKVLTHSKNCTINRANHNQAFISLAFHSVHL